MLPGPGDEISAAAIQRGRPRPANDTWIAACALAYGLPLATLNTKDFKDFAEHGGLSLIIRPVNCTGFENALYGTRNKLRNCPCAGSSWSG